MHSVDRGPAPPALDPIRTEYTPRWEAYYPDRLTQEPSDSRWREFSADVGRVFSQLCGYCEEWCRGEVDHFRPKSRFPSLVYNWTNWVLSCHSCNHAKSNRWPPRGYVDPCAITDSARPERFFNFDTETAELLPMEGLTPTRRKKAMRMIDDLKLNDSYHLKKRLSRKIILLALLSDDLTNISEETSEVVSYLSDRTIELSSFTMALLE